jgi:hypothetical protein
LSHFGPEQLNALWPVHTEAFARMLKVVRDVFDGDLDAMFVLLVVAYGAQNDDWQAVLLGRPDQAGSGKPTNPTSIALATGIPRQTVRRKLLMMQEKGWLKQDCAGHFEITLRAAEDLRPATLATMKYLRAILAAGP